MVCETDDDGDEPLTSPLTQLISRRSANYSDFYPNDIFVVSHFPSIIFFGFDFRETYEKDIFVECGSDADEFQKIRFQ